MKSWLANTAIVIVNYNSGKYLHRCLKSLESQSVKPNRIVVVDNASADRETQRARRGFPYVEFIRLGENVGYAAANNLGIRICESSEWIAFLNPDVTLHEKWLYSMAKAAQVNQDFVGFGSRLLKAEDPSRLDGIGDAYHTSGTVWRLRYGRKVTEKDDVPREIFSPCTAAALFKTEALLEAGGFDEDYFCYLEDVDLGFRLRLLGYKCLYVPEAVAYHVGSVTTGRHSDFYVYHGHRNIVWTYFKNMPLPLFLLYFPQHVFLNLFSMAWFSARGHAPVIFRAKRDAIKGIGRVLRKRKEIQRRKRVSAPVMKRHLASGIKGLMSRNRVDF